MTGENVAITGENVQRYPLFGVPKGYDSLFLARRARDQGGAIIYIAADDLHYQEVIEGLRFFCALEKNAVEILPLPAWDCLPYDRVSPTADVVGERLKTLSRLVARGADAPPCILVTTVAAAAQRIVPRAALKDAFLSLRQGGRIDMRRLQDFFAANGYHRTETVREPGEFAIRGGLIDVFPSGAESPIRIDTFGEDIEHIRYFDPASQRTTETAAEVSFFPVTEVLLNTETIREFRMRYRDTFGAVRQGDPLYEAVSEGRKYAGMEHWLPFFYPTLETVFDYLPAAEVIVDYQAEQARDARWQQIDDLYQARFSIMQAEGKGQASVYRPVPMPALFLPNGEWHAALASHAVVDLVPFPPAQGQADGGGRRGRDFGEARAKDAAGFYRDIAAHVQGLRRLGKKVIIAAYGEGSRDRIRLILSQNGLDLTDAETAVLGLETGFEAAGIAVISEQDMLGDRLSRVARKKKKSDAIVFEVSQLNEGDYVVHQEHGIGQFEKLETVVVDNIPHDCLKIIYAGGDKLFVPVEHLDVLSRYGSAEAGAVLDRLGGSAWQARKARVKRDLLALANELMKVAALRVLRHAEPVVPDQVAYEKFSAGFPYPETEDQQKAIDDVLRDLAAGQPMDRLVCGDVGFGKTEVALRAAAAAALSGRQVAVIAPTTLLARQHYQEFSRRFAGFPVKIGLLSRFVSAREAEKTRQEAARGDLSILVGTHALLGDKVAFADLALLVVDEEQKFGVKQKEKIKSASNNVHVLTLTATPIPRTLQMALAGVRELSLITTAPIDRLAVKTFVLPFDAVVIRDALMREHYRGGQSFYVCPRISDLEGLQKMLADLVPELKVIVAHGQMAPEELEEKMTAFYDGAFDILLSTNIVESGLDIPNANTMVVHRAELFGLAQLYQLRGRIGRSKKRAYAYLTFEADKKLTKAAEQRLHVIERLDTLGAGFQLASHDLDLRGAGNLLGEEQSGHIREIGVELYQQMLEDAVAAARGEDAEIKAERWSPQINLGMPVMIPEGYIPDLNLRLSIYRRIAELATRADIDAFAAELIDRFGSLPADVENLLTLVEIKQLCRSAGIDRIEAGPKGALVSFHPSSRVDLPRLVAYIQAQSGTARIRPEDQKLVFMRPWEEMDRRVTGIFKILRDIVALVV